MNTAAVTTLTEPARRLYPGLARGGVVALAGSFPAAHYDAPALLALLSALPLGLGFTMQARDDRVAPGVDFCPRTVLRIGVALLGARIGPAQLQMVGASPLVLVAVTVPLILTATVVGGRWLGLPTFAGIVAGAALAICGVAAAIAVAVALPVGKVDERRLLGVAISVAVLGTVGMVLLPSLTELLGHDAIGAGLFLGATIHDFAQAAGAGYPVSELSGDVATLTQLLRVAALVPFILLLGFWFRRGERGGAGIPLFLIAFVVLLGLDGGGLLPTMAALGMRTFRYRTAAGARPAADRARGGAERPPRTCRGGHPGAHVGGGHRLTNILERGTFPLDCLSNTERSLWQPQASKTSSRCITGTTRCSPSRPRAIPRCASRTASS